MTEKTNNRGTNPNSLKALKPWTSEQGREMAYRSAEAKRRRKAMSKEMRDAIFVFKREGEDILDQMPKSVDILRILMANAMANDDYEKVEELATKIAEYETPKQQRIESQVTTRDVTEMSDEELAELAQLEAEIVDLKVVK